MRERVIDRVSLTQEESQECVRYLRSRVKREFKKEGVASSGNAAEDGRTVAFPS